MGITYFVGVDEVGRGPLAGPVTVCACAVRIPYAKKILPKMFRGIKDSKQLDQTKREMWLSVINKEKKKGNVLYGVTSVSAAVIDDIGIAPAIRKALRASLLKLKLNPKECQVLLDGSLYAPKEFSNQKTIIKGDEKEPIISMASIVAKVTRDRKMVAYSLEFPRYSFDINKGYGTKVHRSSIKKYGSTRLHRRSFLTKILKTH